MNSRREKKLIKSKFKKLIKYPVLVNDEFFSTFKRSEVKKNNEKKKIFCDKYFQ